MTVGTFTRPWAIIGVVGNTICTKFKPDNELNSAEQALVQLAEQVGAAIATQRHVVLTGGHHQRREASVKYRALLGAVNAASEIGIARLIGIVPRSISAALPSPVKTVSVDAQVSGPLRYMYVHTQLRSEQRNPITGQAVDVLIALKGGTGTAQEVTASLEAGRSVVFLNSWDALKTLVKSSVLPAKPPQATTAGTAVNMALDIIGWGKPSQGLNGSFPVHFPDLTEYECLKAEYERELLKL